MLAINVNDAFIEGEKNLASIPRDRREKTRLPHTDAAAAQVDIFLKNRHFLGTRVCSFAYEIGLLGMHASEAVLRHLGRRQNLFDARAISMQQMSG
jgi:hypothetical protein